MVKQARDSVVRQEYFHWLCDLIHAETGAASYLLLMGYLHSRTFEPVCIPNDDNRAMDGINLQREFMYNSDFENYGSIDKPCSVLEMLIALAQRMDFELSDCEDDCDQSTALFWEMISNLGLMSYSDDMFAEYGGMDNVSSIVDQFLNRDYEKDGTGGIFPLRHTTKNQRKTELWYQMHAYLYENYPV